MRSHGHDAVISGSTISYGSDYIPLRSVTFTEEGDAIYWIDWQTGAQLFRASTDGTGLMKLGAFDLSVKLSPDLEWVAFQDSHVPADTSLFVSRLGRLEKVEIASTAPASGSFAFTWRSARP